MRATTGVRFTLPQLAADGPVGGAGRHQRGRRCARSTTGWVELAPHSLMLLRYGAERRLVVDVPSRGSIVAEVRGR